MSDVLKKNVVFKSVTKDLSGLSFTPPNGLYIGHTPTVQGYTYIGCVVTNVNGVFEPPTIITNGGTIYLILPKAETFDNGSAITVTMIYSS